MTLLEHLLNERAWLYARLREIGQEIKAEQDRTTITQTPTPKSCARTLTAAPDVLQSQS